MGLQGKIVAVTGAASGIGAAVAACARAQGADVIALDRDDSAPGITHIDLSDAQSIERTADALPDRIDVLCNVAGVPGTAAPETVVAVNFLGLRHLSEQLRSRLHGGAVVNVASAAGNQWASVLGPVGELLGTSSMAEGLAWFAANPQEMPAYNFSKAAVIVWTMRTAWAWREDGIRMNSVSPGAIQTRILPDFRATMGPVLDMVEQLVGRHGTPEEIAPLVCFLASPEAGWVNGADVLADGGFINAAKSGGVDTSALAAAAGHG
jgi:NAD(P)-dependent dehydrogenase (short-subunit alcohol dehydrogenase family)